MPENKCGISPEKSKSLQRITHFCTLLLILHCASNVKTNSKTISTAKNDWKINHPVSSINFIGVGSSKIGSDIGEVQKRAEADALRDISEQIKVKIESRTVSNEITVDVNEEFFDSSLYAQNIRTYSDAIFEGVETVETDTSDGYYWVRMELTKNNYFAKVNDKINNARQIAKDALIAADKSDPVKRVHELLTALKSIDDFKGSLLKCTLNGEEIILNTEILRRMRQTLSDIVLKASFDELQAGALDSFPDSTGFNFLYKNSPVENCQLRWSASQSDVKLFTPSGRPGGFYPVQISSLSSSTGKVIRTAAIDFSTIRNDLNKLGLKVPEGKFIVSRQKPTLFLKNQNTFSELLGDELSGRNMFSLIDSEDEADFILSGSLEMDPDVTVQRSIFKANGVLDCVVTKHGETVSTGIRKNISTGSGKSAESALQSLKKEAIENAIQKIQAVF